MQFPTKYFILSALTVLALAGCGGATSSTSTSSVTDGDSDSDASSSSGTSGSVVGGNVSELTVDADGTATVSIDDLSDSDNVVIAIYSYNTENSSEAFQVSSENTAFLVNGDVSAPLDDENDQSDNDDLTEDFHAMLRADEENLDPDVDSPVDAGASQNLVRALTTGASQNFRVLSSFSNSSSYTTVTATLRVQNEYFEIWVDDRDEDTLDDSDLEELAEGFAAVIPQENDLFGTESDVNGDGKFAVLFSRVVNSLGASAGGIVTGFFYATDLFDTTQYPNSNEMEIIYALVPDPNEEYSSSAISKSFFMSNLAPGVMVHEYQHMISFNQHYFINGGSSEESWLNEGLSHLAEDLYTVNASDYMTETGMENPARVSGYLENISTICFSCGSSLNQRGGSYLFLRYLYEQAEQGQLAGAASGAELIQNLLDTSERGVTNVVHSAIGSTAAISDFKSLIGNFSVAVYLSNTGYNSSETVNFDGINLRATQDDNRGTTLNGPAIRTVSALPFTGTVQGSGIHYLQISGSTINDNGGELSFSFSADASFGAYVITQ